MNIIRAIAKDAPDILKEIQLLKEEIKANTKAKNKIKYVKRKKH